MGNGVGIKMVMIKSNDKYVGEIKNGKFNGQGTRTLTDGRKYVGEYKNDKRHGQGTYYQSVEQNSHLSFLNLKGCTNIL